MTTGLIAVAYYPSYFDRLVRQIHRIAKYIDFDVIVLVLNNRLISASDAQRKVDREGRSFYVIEHDNSGAEFGGYQAGLNFLTSLANCDDVLILNDTVGIHSALYTEQIIAIRRLLQDRTLTGKIVGHVDCSMRQLGISGLRGSRWVRSNLMFLDVEALAAIEHIIQEPAALNWVRDTADMSLFFADQINEDAKELLSNWLFKSGGWNKAEPLCATNQKPMAIKALSVLQELYLSMRLESVGVAIVDVRLRDNELLSVLLKRRAKRFLARLAGNESRPYSITDKLE